MSTALRVVVQATKDRKAVRAWAVRPSGSGPLQSALEKVTEAFPGAQVLPPDFRFEREADGSDFEYGFGTLAEIRFGEAQQPGLLAELVRDIGEALAKQGYAPVKASCGCGCR